MRSIAALLILLDLNSAFAQDAPKESDYYTKLTFPLPKGSLLEVGGIQKLTDGKLAVSTRRGEIWTVENAFTNKADDVVFERFAHGLHEVLGITQKDGWLYATQRCELSRIKDEDADGMADLFETVNDGWEINGDYHEYAFGSKFDKNGDIWIVLCLTGSFNSNCKYRGWCVRVNSKGELIPTCSGIRSPGGIGFNASGDVFYTDNQGPWNGTCSLKWLRPKSFQGHPAGNRWYSEPAAQAALGPAPKAPMSGSRIMTEAKKIPEYEPPAILFPYRKMGQSASGVACDITAGKFGPFQNQMFVGDQTFSTVMRCNLEKIDGHYQGACFPFLEGFDSGSLAVEITDDGSMFVGGTNRGWGSRGKSPHSLERVYWTGKVPFEIHEMRARPDGFELTFTKPVDPTTAQKIESYKISTYTYIFQSAYGSPEVDATTPTITEAVVSPDNQSVRLYVSGLQLGHVHELHSNGVRSKAGLPLLHPQAYYTLNYLPKN